VLVVVIASCGGSSRAVRSAPPSTVEPGLHARLLLGGGSGSEGRASLAPALYPVRSTRYVLDAPLADLGAVATVRRLFSVHVTESEVRRLVAAVGLGAGVVARTADGLMVSGPDGSLSVSLVDDDAWVVFDRGGPIAVGGSTSGTAGGPATPAGSTAPRITAPTGPSSVEAPNPTDAARIARGLLERMGVLGTQRWAVDVSNSGGVAVACPAGVACAQTRPVVFDRTVTFHRVLDGQTVEGADWSVTIGANGAVESISGMWATAEAAGSFPLRSTLDAFTDLQAGRTHPVGPQPMMALGATRIAYPGSAELQPPIVVHITGVSLGYSTWNAFDGAAEHVDIVPTYRFHARVTNDAATYDIEVLALKPGTFDIVNMPVPTPRRTSPPNLPPTPNQGPRHQQPTPITADRRLP
jgi:hypothetical protein